MNVRALDTTVVKRGVCWVAGVAVLACAVCSLRWRAVHDVPIMMYTARLITESHLIPYRDFFDMNLPGTYWMMGFLVRFFGCSDLAVRLFDLLLLGCVSCFTFIGLRRWGRETAFIGVFLIALRYFAGTWELSLQREFLALVPFSAVMALATWPACFSWKGGALLGLLFAWMFLIKPQFLLFAIPVLLFVGWGQKECGAFLRFLLSFGAGFSLPLVSCAVWLMRHDAWQPFLELVSGYWPLYGQMSFAHEVLTGGARLNNILRGAERMVLSWYVLVAFAGIAFWARLGKSSFKGCVFFFSMIGCAVIFPSLTGQFWGYHKIPFFYLTLYAASFTFAQGSGDEKQCKMDWARVMWGTLLVVAWIGVAVPRSCREAFCGGAVEITKQGVPDQVARYLKGHLVKGDRVQPLDWTGGAVHGMLMADALPATRFLYDFHFYHHLNAPAIQRIRQEFMRSLESAPPRFLVETLGQLRPHGPGASDTFAEFELWRAGRYHVAESKSGYRIWERNRPGDKRE